MSVKMDCCQQSVTPFDRSLIFLVSIDFCVTTSTETANPQYNASLHTSALCYVTSPCEVPMGRGGRILGRGEGILDWSDPKFLSSP